MDIRMPKLDAIEARLICGTPDTERTRVVILTTFDLDEYVYAALRAGASGFLHISPATARPHVGHLLTKLAARDRAQLVITTYETGLVAPRTPPA